MMFEQQPSKSVPRWVRLDIGRNIDELCQSRNPQLRMQRGNQDVRSFGTTRPLRGVFLIYGTCEVTDEGAQETTIRAYLQVNPGIIIVDIPRTTSMSNFEFCKASCTCQHDRGVLYIVILTDCEGTFHEEQHLALETLHWSEGSAWLGRDVRQMETGARLKNNPSAMSWARMWTKVFTMAENTQQEAITRKGALYSKVCAYLPKIMTRGGDHSHNLQFAQQRRLLRVYVCLGYLTIGEFCRVWRNDRSRRGVVRWVKFYFKCP